MHPVLTKVDTRSVTHGVFFLDKGSVKPPDAIERSRFSTGSRTEGDSALFDRHARGMGRARKQDRRRTASTDAGRGRTPSFVTTRVDIGHRNATGPVSLRTELSTLRPRRVTLGGTDVARRTPRVRRAAVGERK